MALTMKAFPVKAPRYRRKDTAKKGHCSPGSPEKCYRTNPSTAVGLFGPLALGFSPACKGKHRVGWAASVGMLAPRNGCTNHIMKMPTKVPRLRETELTLLLDSLPVLPSPADTPSMAGPASHHTLHRKLNMRLSSL